MSAKGEEKIYFNFHGKSHTLLIKKKNLNESFFGEISAEALFFLVYAGGQKKLCHRCVSKNTMREVFHLMNEFPFSEREVLAAREKSKSSLASFSLKNL